MRVNQIIKLLAASLLFLLASQLSYGQSSESAKKRAVPAVSEPMRINAAETAVEGKKSADSQLQWLQSAERINARFEADLAKDPSQSADAALRQLKIEGKIVYPYNHYDPTVPMYRSTGDRSKDKQLLKHALQTSKH